MSQQNQQPSKGKKRARSTESVNHFKSANAKHVKKMRIEHQQALFREEHGDSFNIYIFRKDLEKMDGAFVAKFTTDLAVHQVTEDIDFATTKSQYKPNERAYLIRVHTQEERNEIHDMINKLYPYLTTYCPMDKSDTAKVTLRLPPEFPEVLLKPEMINKLLSQTVGKLIGSKIESCNILKPPFNENLYGRKKLRIEVGVPQEIYLALEQKEAARFNKNKPLTSHLLTHEVTVHLPRREETAERPNSSTAQRTATAAQRAFIAAKEAERVCVEAITEQNRETVQNALTNLEMN